MEIRVGITLWRWSLFIETWQATNGKLKGFLYRQEPPEQHRHHVRVSSQAREKLRYYVMKSTLWKSKWEDTERLSMKYPSFLHKLGGHLWAIQINNCSPLCLRFEEWDNRRVLPLNSQVFRKQWYTCQEWTPSIFPAARLSASIQNISLHARYNTRGLSGKPKLCLKSKEWLMRKLSRNRFEGHRMSQSFILYVTNHQRSQNRHLRVLTSSKVFLMNLSKQYHNVRSMHS